MKRLNKRIQPRLHTVHDKFPRLTVCGAGSTGMITGNIRKAKYPCRMCEKGV
jgi:hypothetical protein